MLKKIIGISRLGYCFWLALVVNAAYGVIAAAQPSGDQSIVIMVPRSIIIEDALAKEYEGYERKAAEDYIRMEQYLTRIKTQRDSVPEHLRADFDKQRDALAAQMKYMFEMLKTNRAIHGQIATTLKGYLEYFLIEQTPGLQVILTPDSAIADGKRLRAYTKGRNARYLANITNIELFKESGVTRCKMTAQLYDVVNDTVFVEGSYESDASNQGGPFECADGALLCAVINGLSQYVSQVSRAIYLLNPDILTEQTLFAKRSLTLLNSYFERNCDPSIQRLTAQVKNIPSKATVDFCLTNSDNTQLITFLSASIQAGSIPAPGSVNDYGDRSFVIQDDENLGEQAPTAIYACILLGAQYEGKWYFVKKNVSYVRAQSIGNARRTYFLGLQRHQFFKPKSADFNPEFWEIGLFEKIPQFPDAPVSNEGDYAEWERKWGEWNIYAEYKGVIKFVADALIRQ